MIDELVARLGDALGMGTSISPDGRWFLETDRLLHKSWQGYGWTVVMKSRRSLSSGWEVFAEDETGVRYAVCPGRSSRDTAFEEAGVYMSRIAMGANPPPKTIVTERATEPLVTTV